MPRCNGPHDELDFAIIIGKNSFYIELIPNILVVGEEYAEDLLDHMTFSHPIASLFRALRGTVQ